MQGARLPGRPAVSHDELLEKVTQLCGRLGHWCYAPRTSLTAPKGWPDIVILGRHGALFVELKSSDGRRTKSQIRVALRIQQAGLEYRLWRPEQWEDGTITAELSVL
jgi:hypothetical protein